MAIKQKLCRALLYPFLWPIIHMPGKSHSGPLPALTNEHLDSKENLISTVTRLAVGIGQRNAKNYGGLLDSAALIKDCFERNGFTVSHDSFQFDGVEMHNVIGELRGKERPDEIVLAGAHYDTVYGSPGADDNASGVAVLLELARIMSDQIQGRTLRLVAFANEENPGNAPWETMGSYHYAKACKERGDNIVGMISLEMLGYYSDAPGSQTYPLPFSLVYPSVGNFVAFVGYLDTRKWIKRCIGSFRNQTLFPSEGVAAPAFLRDVNRSDHWSFRQFGYPSMMLTDTSNFRNKLYHTVKDTPGILDFDRMARVTIGVAAMLKDIVNE
jgi:hypothetical protein